MALLRDNLHVVLHQTRLPENLGAVLRLMSNFGFETIIMSEPQLVEFHDAEKMARKGADLLAQLRVEKNLDDALADVVYAVGSTSREAIERRATIDPEEAVARLLQHAQRGKVALLLGGEKRGLSDEDLSRCQDICVIPTMPEPQPSMNLAQAAAVLLYLCSRADRPAMTDAPVPEGARLRTIQVFEQQFKEVMLGSGFLSVQAPQYVLEELMQSLHRGQLTQREVELWMGAFKALSRHVNVKST